MKLLQEFLYTPQSGSKIFASNPHGEIALVTFENRSHLLLSTAPSLNWSAAGCGKYWRERAGAIARSIVEAASGYAWDDQGTVGFCVPSTHVWDAYTLMQAANPNFDRGLGANEVRLIESGLGALTVDGQEMKVRRRCRPPVSLTVENMGGHWRVINGDEVWAPNPDKSKVWDVEGGHMVSLNDIEWPISADKALIALVAEGACLEGSKKELEQFGEWLHRDEVEEWMSEAPPDNLEFARKALRHLMRPNF